MVGSHSIRKGKNYCPSTCLAPPLNWFSREDHTVYYCCVPRTQYTAGLNLLFRKEDKGVQIPTITLVAISSWQKSTEYYKKGTQSLSTAFNVNNNHNKKIHLVWMNSLRRDGIWWATSFALVDAGYQLHTRLYKNLRVLYCCFLATPAQQAHAGHLGLAIFFIFHFLPGSQLLHTAHWLFEWQWADGDMASLPHLF